MLGTAGHIDHGKTALVEALTGTDTDRLPEEKARGITIELGFAALDLPGVGRVSVVDVPGHEGLVRTMVSGATGIDVVLIVVAADEGVMPQTREHVAICDLLGLRRAVVALSRTDLADDEMVTLAEDEVRALLAPTGLADAPIVPVSSRTGAGLDRLRERLAEVISRTAPGTTRTGPPRLAIDRCFAMRGFGSVVTGTLVGGPLREGDAVCVLPRDLRARVRGLQVHGQSVRALAAGHRCAVNLQGIELADLRRGDVVTRPGSCATTAVFDVVLSWLGGAAPVSGIASVELLTGTAQRRARLAPIGPTAFQPGVTGFARVHVEGEPLTLLPADRFIVRGFARGDETGATLGGGVVIDVAPPRRRRSDPSLVRELEILARPDSPAALAARVHRRGFAGIDVRDLALETGLDTAAIEAALGDLERSGEVARAGPRRLVSGEALERLQAVLTDALDAFHTAEPLRPGMPRAALRGRLPGNVPNEVAERALADLEAGGRLERSDDLLHRPAHRPALSPEDARRVAGIVEEARAAGLEPPGPREWAERLGVPLDHFRDLVAHLEREDELVRAPGDLWFARAAVDGLRERVVAHLEAHGRLETQDYKALIGTSRRTAMPLMELLDELHVTRRQGDARVLRKP